jgi:hypothetical protein
MELETSQKVTWRKVIKMCKVHWNDHSKDEATWERENELIAQINQLFSNLFESRGQDSL